MTQLALAGLAAEVRPATPADVPQLLAFIREMAIFERMTTEATEATLHEALFGDPPAVTALLAFVSGEPAGYMTYFYTFGSMTGRRGLWLDDVYVAPVFRGRGLGRALMRHLAGIARDHGCARFEWLVLDWNEAALALYRSLGAAVLEDHRVCRLDAAGILALAQS